jgi:cytochrome c oxidase subunit II
MRTNRAQWIKYLAPFVGLCLTMSVYAMQQSAVNPAGPQSGRIGGLYRLLLYVLTAIYVIVMIVVAIAAFRRRDHAQNDLIAPQHDRERRFKLSVTAGVLTTIAILFVFLVSSYFVGRALHTNPDPANTLIIEVNGHQWWWDVRYDNPVPSQIVTTANEIHIPVGRPVMFRLNSSDVIHSFWVPNLHGKTDMIPGRTLETWLQADHAGVYRGQCAEFCGHQHAHMAFVVIAEPVEQFQAWYQAQLQSAAAPTTESQMAGQKLFLSKPCYMCHRIQGTDAGGRVGPDLTHVASRQTIAAGTLETTRDHLQKWVLNSQSVKPGNRMPPLPMDNSELNALLDYLQTLK